MGARLEELEPEVNSSVSFIDMLSYLDGAPFVGSFEARYGSLGIYGKPRFLDVGRRIPARDRFAPDSPLEEAGFEASVPLVRPVPNWLEKGARALCARSAAMRAHS